MLSFAIHFALVACSLSGISGVKIKKLDVPNVVRDGTGPVTLSCDYEVEKDETGLVVKWFYDEDELIYQWIPPMFPQDTGVIKGKADYPNKILDSPRSRSVIRLREVDTKMGGDYTCIVSTFQSEQIKTRKMTVYVPETNVTLYTLATNETHVRLVCEVQGAWPRPIFEFQVEGAQVKGRMAWVGDVDYKKNGLRVRYEAVIEEPEVPVLVQCDINIPMTEYRRRESVVYYPHEFLWEVSAVQKISSVNSRIVLSLPIIFLIIT